ncbi:MAG: glycosyltransferase [Candidatus Nomurabacteria bacterium]|jgi:glycosyltransferase involved in cell wall biosynthesis|nr:glycosyltransferase [Candidatus Nomurabacteria bacterium]
MKAPFFSVVIPTLNEEVALPVLLKDLTRQIYDDFEVIHVDGRSDDKTVERAGKFADELSLRTVPCRERNVSVQRNKGGELARGQWIIFLDADVQLNDDFLLGIRYKISTFERRGRHLDVFSTLIALNDVDKEKTKHVISMRVINSFLQSTAASDAPRLFGAMIGVRRKLFKEVHFDRKVKFAEDVEFVKQCIIHNGVYRIFRAPTYKYDMRRWDEKSLPATTINAIKLQIQLMLDKETDYEMSGGTKYKSDPK